MKRAEVSLNVTRGLCALVLAVGCATVTGGPPAGGEEEQTPEDKSKLGALAGKLSGKSARVVWSSSRFGNHDLFAVNPDGSDLVQLTKGDEVDWFPRYAPDGQRILFVRSQKGWVSERDANALGKWDLYLLPAAGGKPEKVVADASWGTWVDDQTILFVRGTKLYQRALSGGDEKLLVDSEKDGDLEGALLQQPQMSRDRRFVAITLRGSRRETGVWDTEKKTWSRTGDGCQINWTPDGRSVYWVHPTGNGSSRVLRQEMKGAAAAAEKSPDDLTLIDLPGRRSHEYFPQLSADGQWMVWAATQRGHDHDIADYEIYLWEVGKPDTEAARLTFHSGNDRWPDIYIPGAVAGGKTSEVAADAEKVLAASDQPALKPAALKETGKAAKRAGKGKKGKKARRR